MLRASGDGENGARRAGDRWRSWAASCGCWEDDRASELTESAGRRVRRFLRGQRSMQEAALGLREGGEQLERGVDVGVRRRAGWAELLAGWRRLGAGVAGWRAVVLTARRVHITSPRHLEELALDPPDAADTCSLVLEVSKATGAQGKRGWPGSPRRRRVRRTGGWRQA